jgi:HSP20 family protein
MNRKNPLEPFESLLMAPPFNGRFFGSIEIDVEESDEEVRVVADIPGFNREEINLEVTRGSVLTISAERSINDSDDEVVFTERRQNVSRRITLPATVSITDAEATYNNGVLTVTLPKTDESSNTHIPIE